MNNHTAIKIREARGSDAAAIAALYRSLVSSPHIRVRADRLETIASDANNFVFVCEVDKVILGTATLTLCLDAMFGNQPYGVLENLVIDEGWRGKEIGSQLIEYVEELCRVRDCSKIMLLSSTSRESAHHFFERQGFMSMNKRGFIKYRGQFREFQGIPDKVE